MENKKEIINYLENISLFVLGILLIGFPLILTSLTTDPLGLPKQAVLVFGLLIILLCFGIKMIFEKSVKFRRTPFDLPIGLFTVAVFISSLLALNRVESLIAFLPLLFSVIIFFAVVNTAKDNKSLVFLKLALLTGASLLSVLAVLSFLKIYILPFEFSKNQLFTPIGSLLDQAIYLALVLPVALYPVIKAIKSSEQVKALKGAKIGFAFISVILLIGLSISIYQIIAKQTLTLLPYEIGFQTAFAAISQDAGRIAQGFFFGSGFGTYGTDFARFKQATFNNSPLWSLSFFKSSSFMLELLATTGMLGFMSFFFVIYKALRERPLYPSLVLAVVALFLLPFSFVNTTLFFILIGFLAAKIGAKHNQKVFDVELQLVAFKKGFISFEAPEEEKSSKSILLPVAFLAVIAVFTAYTGYLSFQYLKANLLFQSSLIAAAQNNGSLTYQKQAEALALFPNNDAYQRLFSQTNLALANNLSAQIPQDSSPSAETTQTIYTLIQQSINAGRTATTLSPQTALNWQNLSSVYRSLIGFGQNADQFALLTAQQAVALDPNNPQQYINLGGIYFQLKAWDKAAQQFSTAASIKPDYSNAYYNLGHALEETGDLKGALAQYQTVKTLAVNDKESLKKITAEIDALEKKIKGVEEAQVAPQEEGALKLNTPETQLPIQNPPVKIPAPEAKVTPTPEETTNAPTPQVSPTQ